MQTFLRASFLLSALIWVIGCSAPKPIDSPNAGRTLSYDIGVPNFDMEAIPTWRDDKAGIDLYIGLPYRSLIFLNQGGSFKARYEVAIRLMDEKGKSVLKEESFGDEILVQEYDLTQTIASIPLKKRFLVTPGIYVVEVGLSDLNSKKDAIRRQRITVPDLASGNLSLSRMLVEGRRGEKGFEPIVAYHTGADVDSLRAVVELYNADATPVVEARMVLKSLPTDRAPAQPPFWFMPNVGSVAYQGVLYNKPDTLQVSRQTVRNVGSELVVEFLLPKLMPGTYRIDISVTAPNKTLLREQRDLSIKAPGFPRVETLQQLIEPLAYIAYKKEMMQIIAGKTPAEQKERFDTFWGEKMPSRQSATNAIKEFYSRVEQANLMFSTYKEGWKTDPGMVYIIMGPPQYVDEQMDMEVWRYSSSGRDPLSTFAFQKVRPIEGDFINYVLMRNPYFEQEWLRQIERWRMGMAF